MKKIFHAVREYLTDLDPLTAAVFILYTAILVFLNYYFGINKYITRLDVAKEYPLWSLLFCCSFVLPYSWILYFNKKHHVLKWRFVLMLMAAPLIFGWKMSSKIHMRFSSDEIENAYWNVIAYWPTKLVVVLAALFIIAETTERSSMFGLRQKVPSMKPYWLMLLIMLPLIALASLQPDFLDMYPKFQNLKFLQLQGWFHRLLFELSYGSDFIGIEMFFRGFLILSFAKYVGKDAILPMAVFYCTIHFGKPLAECISSFFGGIVLGIITYHTRSILGGLLVHLGIAWLMELGGFLGNLHLHHVRL